MDFFSKERYHLGMAFLIAAVRLLFTLYSLMLLVRVCSSWFPRLQRTAFIHFLAHYTDPYLNVLRRLIPRIGGGLDLSPVIAFFLLQLLEFLLIRLLLMLL